MSTQSDLRSKIERLDKKKTKLEAALRDEKLFIERGDFDCYIPSTYYNLFSGASRLSNNELVIVARKLAYEEIKDESDERLRNYYQYGENVYGRRLPDFSVGIPYNFARGLAAADILEDRYGRDYKLELAGKRQPETFKEKLEKILLGKYPDRNS